MSAEILRRAAALMRERAETADQSCHQYANGWGDVVWSAGPGLVGPEKRYAASWHPAAALAVADWLEAEAREHDADPDFADDCCRMPQALIVARAYLGSDDD